MKIFQKLEKNMYEKRVFQGVKKTIKNISFEKPCLSRIPLPSPTLKSAGWVIQDGGNSSKRESPV